MRPCANSFFCENEFHLHANGKKFFTSLKGVTPILRNGQLFYMYYSCISTDTNTSVNV